MENKNKNIPAEPFIPFGRYLLADRRDKLITYRELELYNWVRFHANMFGIGDISTGKLLDDLPHFKSVDYINKTLRSLRKKGYISYEDRKGDRSSFGVRFDYWLGEGGSIWTLNEDGHYILRGKDLSSGSSRVDGAPMLGAHSPMSDVKETIEDTTQKDSPSRGVVRGNKNEKEIDKKNETFIASTPVREKHSSKKIPVSEFEAKNDVEERCKDIAIDVGEEYMNYILSRLNHKDGGIEVIEEGYKRFLEVMKMGDVGLDPVEHPPAVFNHSLEGALSDNQYKKQGLM